jgi:molybdopterin converting factor small subunit
MKSEAGRDAHGIVVTVRLYGALRSRRPPGAPGEPHHPFELSLEPGATLQQVIDLLAIPEGRLSGMAINGQVARPGDTLSQGDQVSLFPPVAGGRGAPICVREESCTSSSPG